LQIRLEKLKSRIKELQIGEPKKVKGVRQLMLVISFLLVH
jgi:hypothetical protein